MISVDQWVDIVELIDGNPEKTIIYLKNKRDKLNLSPCSWDAFESKFRKKHMSTRSNIGIRQDDGSVKFIYCHNDGYPSWNGKVLLNHYNEKEKVEQIISMGDASCLNENIGKAVNFNDYHSYRGNNQCIFYKRDRGDEHTDAATASKEDFALGHAGAEYVYLFENDRWSFIDLYDDDSKWSDLENCLNIKDIIE